MTGLRSDSSRSRRSVRETTPRRRGGVCERRSLVSLVVLTLLPECGWATSVTARPCPARSEPTIDGLRDAAGLDEHLVDLKGLTVHHRRAGRSGADQAHIGELARDRNRATVARVGPSVERHLLNCEAEHADTCEWVLCQWESIAPGSRGGSRALVSGGTMGARHGRRAAGHTAGSPLLTNCRAG